MEDRWLSVDEVAIYLEIKRDTVCKWIVHKNMLSHIALPKMTTNQLNSLHSTETPALGMNNVVRSLAR